MNPPLAHNTAWRDSAQVSAFWHQAAQIDAAAFEFHAAKGWWQTLERLDITLLVGREYEHFILALQAPNGRPRASYFSVPHPSGIAVDRKSSTVSIASTRNPNQIFHFQPLTGFLPRKDIKPPSKIEPVLLPATSSYYPGSLYIHDLAWIGNTLHANATGLNAVVRLSVQGNQFEPVWWPHAAEQQGKHVIERNHIQLNSIAAGKSLADSYFSASSTRIGRLRPSHLRYRVDGQGVIFSGKTREPICTGLTRPHSARLRTGGKQIWVGNSGYGEVGFVRDGKLETVHRLPGWTRGLCLVDDVAFVGTSRILMKYARYAPGLDPAACICGVHAVSCATGEYLGGIEWPNGDQIFAIDWIANSVSAGFPFSAPVRRPLKETAVFYNYRHSPNLKP